MTIRDPLTQCPSEQIDFEAPLEIVAPFTTPELTQNAIVAAETLNHGLNFRIRVVLVQPVPVGWPLDRPPVSLEHLNAELRKLECQRPLEALICLVRSDDVDIWARLLSPKSIVVIASRKRLCWRTREERLSRRFSQLGYQVILVPVV